MIFPHEMLDVYLRYLAEGKLQFSGMCKVTFADTLAIEPDTANYAITINNKDLKQVIVGKWGIKLYLPDKNTVCP